MGVIRSSQSDASYLRDGKVIQVKGADLLACSEPFYAWKSLNLETLPNRDSLTYGKKYGIESATTIFRGTLRYKGFSELLYVFKNMGMFDDLRTGSTTWCGTLLNLQIKHGFSDLRSFILSCSSCDKKLASRFYKCAHWLGLIDTTVSTPVSNPSSIVKSFCDLLEQNLQYKDNERDMVIMHHDITANFRGRTENHSCSLQLYGDDKMTAMCKTVGYSTAIGTKLILDGRIDSKGLILPLSKEVYIPSLDLLNKEGVILEENVLTSDEFEEAR
jgi:saccharopine dehydrogenase-like NADP-dependent oxidoreductase